MSELSKRDAMQLVADIRRANVSGHAIVARCGGQGSAVDGFVGGLEVILQGFLLKNGCREAADALKAAMNYVPSDAEIAAYNAEIAQWRAKATGSAS